MERNDCPFVGVTECDKDDCQRCLIEDTANEQAWLDTMREKVEA
jgi:hypothetical protein